MKVFRNSSMLSGGTNWPWPTPHFPLLTNTPSCREFSACVVTPSHRPSILHNGASDHREGREEEGGRRRQGDLDSRSEGGRVEERRRGRELQESHCRGRLGLEWAPLGKGQGLPCHLEIFSFQTACPCSILFLFLLLVHMILRTILKNKAKTEITSCCWEEENPKTSSTHPVPSELNRALTAPFPAGVLVEGGAWLGWLQPPWRALPDLGCLTQSGKLQEGRQAELPPQECFHLSLPSPISTLFPTAETVGMKGQGETQEKGLGRTEAGPRGKGDEGQAPGTSTLVVMLSCSQSHMPNISFS